MKKRLLSYLLVFIILAASTGVNSKAEGNTLNLKSEAIVLLEETTGKIIYDKNAKAKMYPASTTKVLTALLLIENIKPDEPIIVGREINGVPLDASKAGHKIGDKLTLKQLLMALMLPSGNDSAYVAAMAVAKKTSNNPDLDATTGLAQFSQLMNEKAKAIGAENSHFVNSSGYHEDGHYSTAYDIALITREAMKSELFREVVKTPSFDMEFGAEPERNTTWRNRNLLIDARYSSSYYPYATGVKTGNTDQAGECLVSTATKDGMKLVAVVLKSPQDLRFMESKALFEYGFVKYALYTFSKSGEVIEKLPIPNATKKGPQELEVVAKEERTELLFKNQVEKIEKKIEWSTTPLKAPIEAGHTVGKLTYTLEGEVLGEVTLLAKHSVSKRTIFEFLASDAAIPYWGAILGVITLVLGIMYLMKTRKNRRRFKRRF